MLRISLPFFILLFTYPLEAQQAFASADINEKIYYKAILDYQTDYLHKLYFQKVDDVDELVNGKDYAPYYFRSNIKPLLFNDRKRKSSLILKGRRYDNLTLEYDTYLEELIYSDSSKLIDYKIFKISLNKDPVDGFIFNLGSDSLVFRHFIPDKDLNFNLPEGFYEEVYDGRSKFIIRHRSYLQDEEGICEYIYSPEDYIMVNNGYTKVKNSKGFLKLFGEKSGEIKKFIRTNKVHIRKADKNQIAFVLRFYDSMVSSDK